MLHKKGGGSRKGSGTFMCLRLIVKKSKMSVEHGRVVTTIIIIKH